jgi:hypothetical protein
MTIDTYDYVQYLQWRCVCEVQPMFMLWHYGWRRLIVCNSSLGETDLSTGVSLCPVIFSGWLEAIAVVNSVTTLRAS